jgi:nitrate/nitrite transport system ATP-binding protein
MTQPQTLPNPNQTNIANEFLVVENLVKSYPKSDGTDFTVLQDVNLTIGPQEYIAVIGHSGCGKSTLLKMIAGLEKPTTGSVCLEGKLIRKPGSERMMVFQHYSLLPWLTVRENIRLAVDEVLRKASRSEKISIVNEHIAMVNLTAAADKYPDEISGGMKQRVGIARALATRPKMLLMDEPFGALDALTREAIQIHLRGIWQRTQKTIFFITHDVEEALLLGTRIIIMHARPGRIVKEFVNPFAHRPEAETATNLRISKEFVEAREFLVNSIRSDEIETEIVS